VDVYETLREDPAMAPLVERHGELEIDTHEDLFERLVISILRQQVSMASAAAIRERLFETVSVTPAGILATDKETLRSVGLSSAKARYVRAAARRFREEALSKETFADRPDEEVRSHLTEIPGVGPWTADMQLIFALGREDVFPVGDLGIRVGMAELFDLQREERAAMVETADRWTPFRSYASLYLWRVSDGDTP
jgi:DNA-3-methyladenine glycosylase II